MTLPEYVCISDIAVWDGFLPVSSTVSGELNGQVSQNFDSDFFLISESVNGNAISYDYDNDGLLIRAGNLNLSHENASGLLGSSTLGTVAETISYNAFAEPQNRQIQVNGSPILAFDYDRDKLGRIDTLTETLGGSEVALDYAYDLAGRLVEVQQNGTAIETYAYDANSNRIQSSTAAGTINYTYDDQDRLIEATRTGGTTTYAYNNAGDLQSKTTASATTSYYYDAAGNLRTVTLPDSTEIEYLIDGLDRRVGKQVNGELIKGWLYRDLLNPFAELDGDGNVLSRFVYGEQPNVPAYMIRDGKTWRIVSDHLGSPRLVIDTETGEIIQQMSYDTFGRVIEDSNPGFQPFGFAGGLYDHDTGLVRFGARDYDPETGRWTAKDPIRFAGGDTNLYAYVLNDPVNLIDPLGLFCISESTINIIAAGAGGATAGAFSGTLLGVLAGAAIGAGAEFTAQSLSIEGTGPIIGGIAGAAGGNTLASRIGGATGGFITSELASTGMNATSDFRDTFAGALGGFIGGISGALFDRGRLDLFRAGRIGLFAGIAGGLTSDFTRGILNELSDCEGEMCE
ncbi:MAG: hypothetical protein KKC01_05810 [Gammaproteobacteria bacterium]|nr:hypothetical protein [Gammaproteobacteria bacterium]